VSDIGAKVAILATRESNGEEAHLSDPSVELVDDFPL
jgi:hypothetical protein